MEIFSYIFTFLFIASSLILPLVNFSNLPTKIPLFYSLFWGEQQLVNANQLFLLPLISVLITMVNLIISWHLHPSQLALKKALHISSMLISFIMLVTIVRVIYIFI